MKKEELEESNRAKYGDKKNDLISRIYSECGKQRGDDWCFNNSERYLDRLSRVGSTKAYNKIDVLKSLDYITRTLEYNQRYVKMGKKAFSFEIHVQPEFIAETSIQEIQYHRNNENDMSALILVAYLSELLKHDNLFQQANEILE